jgi:hypothetical protein
MNISFAAKLKYGEIDVSGYKMYNKKYTDERAIRKILSRN